jgi:hypothetical protein
MFALKLHFFALIPTVIKSNRPKIIKKLLVPIVYMIKGTDIKVPIILPEKAKNKSFFKISLKLKNALLKAKTVPIKTIHWGIIVGSTRIIRDPEIPKPIPTAL